MIKKHRPLWHSLLILNLVLSPLIFMNPGECSGIASSLSVFDKVFLTQAQSNCCCSRLNVRNNDEKRDCCNSSNETRDHGNSNFSTALPAICKCFIAPDPSKETSHVIVPSSEEFWLWVVLADSLSSEAVPDICTPVNVFNAGLLHSDSSIQARLQIWLI